MNEPVLHPFCETLRPLLGTWRGRGSGHYPTIDDFEYLEEISFGHVGKPFVAYGQKTRDATTELPLHAEQGYFRPDGEGNVELVLVQPSGIIEIHTGSVAPIEGGVELVLHTVHVATSPTAKDVTEVGRVITVKGETLMYDLSMAAVGLELQHHLNATLQRVE
ncbi:MAG: FABP family protein [Actinomycetota bacterium]|jgi:hypothetical protein|nr:FABP family protein [Actinomycetota bacterium]